MSVTPTSTATAAAPTAEVKYTPAPKAVTLAGKVAIVTGASRGIGAAIALRLARDGAKVIVNFAKDEKAANAVVAAIVAGGGAAAAVQGDVAKSAAVERLFAEAKRLFGKVDIAVANAGISNGVRPLGATSDEQFAEVFDVNVKGVFYVLRAAANHLEAGGRVITLGSVLKSGASQGSGPYSATKAAVEALTNTAAQELGAKGITANTVHPGPTDTDMLSGFLASGPGVADYLKGISPFKRLGTVDDLGDAVALVASDSARWISGQAIFVTGAAK